MATGARQTMPEPLGSLIGIRVAMSRLDPDSCTFNVNRSLLLGGPIAFSAEQHDSALVAAIRTLDGVRDLALRENIVMVAKHASADWAQLKLTVAAEIRSYFSDGPGSAPGDREAPAVAIERPPELVRAAVQKILDERFNPAIASHNGKIEIVDFVDRKLFVTMSGGCQGCAASQSTLRSGLAGMLRRDVPEVAEIVDTTEHSDGKSPYFAR